MAALADLVPNPSTADTYVPRPAATQIVNLGVLTNLLTTESGLDLTTESGVDIALENAGAYGTITALLVVGTRAYGLANSLIFGGFDAPFCYDLAAGALIPVANVSAANLPKSPPATGDWTPPQLEMIANRVMVSHVGFDGVTHFAGWIDVRNFTLGSLTGTWTGAVTTIPVSSNPMTAGVAVGDAVAGANIAAGTYVAGITPTSVILSQATTGSGSATALTFTSGTLAAPLWGAGQMGGGALTFPVPPSFVAQFNGRAWWAVNNTLVFSDSLIPMQCSLGTQAVTCGDSTPVTALSGLPLANQVTGGIVQSLIAFKGSQVYFQITGDPATNNLTNQAVAGSVGTIAPNSVTPTPLGLAYIAPDGLRFVNLAGNSTDPVGADGTGVSVPFIYAINPTRINAAYNQDVLRISVQNGAVGGQPYQEWWYHLSRKAWTGPHSFPASVICPYQNGSINTFVLAGVGIPGKLWQSDAVPGASSVYIENGAPLTWAWKTSLLPDNERGVMNTVVQSEQAYAMPAGTVLNVQASDEGGNALATTTVSSPSVGATTWGAFVWGSYPWGSTTSAFQQMSLDWPNPLNFKQMSVTVTGPSNAGFVIGNLYAEYAPQKYRLTL